MVKNISSPSACHLEFKKETHLSTVVTELIKKHTFGETMGCKFRVRPYFSRLLGAVRRRSATGSPYRTTTRHHTEINSMQAKPQYFPFCRKVPFTCQVIWKIKWHFKTEGKTEETFSEYLATRSPRRALLFSSKARAAVSVRKPHAKAPSIKALSGYCCCWLSSILCNIRC